MERLKIKKISSMEKVFPTREPAADGWRDSILTLRGETTSFQIAYLWKEAGRQRGLVHVNVPEELQVKVRCVGLVPCAYPCHMTYDNGYLTSEPGLYPDLLQEMSEFGFVAVSGQWRSLWVEITTSKAGSYPVEIELKSVQEGIFREKITLTVEVIDAKIPKHPIMHTEWFHCDCLANYYDVEVFNEKHWEIIENFVKTAVKRGCNMLLTPIFTPPLDTDVGGERRTVQLIDVEVMDGGYRFGYEKFERWVDMCRRCGVQYFEMSHLFSQWGASAAPKVVARIDGKEEKIFGWETKGSGVEYTKFLHAFLPSFTKKIEELGIGKQCYFHVSDEPGLYQLEFYRAAKEVVKEDLKNYRMIDALSDYNFYEQGLIDEPVCATDHIAPFLEKRPEHLWAYYCTAQNMDVSNRFIVMPGSRTRILGIQLYKYAIDGFLHWGYNFYNSQFSLYPIDPYRITDADGAFPSGDPFLVYPGKDGKPEESIRILLMQEAFQDLAAMKYLESIDDRESVMECLQEDVNGEITFAQYPADAAYILRVRERVNKKIAEKIEKTLDK